ncbi:hypothetical protein MBRU_02920 [Mycolicibacterium brumae DSM 44177]|nr:hypothetical protein MBRU_02920 [Mycolicibacterium brumae DSM 44177]
MSGSTGFGAAFAAPLAPGELLAELRPLPAAPDLPAVPGLEPGDRRFGRLPSDTQTKIPARRG